MKCSFCGKDIRKGTGTVYVKLDGTVSSFCSKKCMRYRQMKRDPERYSWALKKRINKPQVS